MQTETIDTEVKAPEPVLEPAEEVKSPWKEKPKRGRKKESITDLDGFNAQFHWYWAGMKSRLKRISPQHHNGQQVAGFLEDKENSPFTEAEVKSRFGGGQFEVSAIGPREQGGNQYHLSKHRFNIAGPPNLASLPPEVTQKQQHSPQAQGTGSDNMAAPAQAAMVGIIGDELKYRREAGSNSGTNEGALAAYSQSQEAIERAANERVKAAQESAARESILLRQRLEELNKEIDILRDQKQSSEREMESKISEASSTANNLMMGLLPTLSDSARQQVQDVIRATEAQLARVESQHAKEIESLHRHFDQQLQNNKSFMDMQVNTMKTTYEGQMTLLQGQIQNASAKNDMLERENKNLANKFSTTTKTKKTKKIRFQ